MPWGLLRLIWPLDRTTIRGKFGKLARELLKHLLIGSYTVKLKTKLLFGAFMG